jgi:hypothetical protein
MINITVVVVTLLCFLVQRTTGLTTGCVDKTSQGGACCSGDIEISTNVVAIADYAFSQCTNTNVAFHTTLTKIGYRAFDASTALTWVIIPTSVVSLSGFDSGSVLTRIDIPTSVTAIGDDAFHGCGSLASIAIPSSVVDIGLNAFKYCSALTSITIPASVTSIGATAFGDALIPPCNTGNNKMYVPASTAVSVYSGVQGSCSVETYIG